MEGQRHRTSHLAVAVFSLPLALGQETTPSCQADDHLQRPAFVCLCARTPLNCDCTTAGNRSVATAQERCSHQINGIGVKRGQTLGSTRAYPHPLICSDGCGVTCGPQHARACSMPLPDVCTAKVAWAGGRRGRCHRPLLLRKPRCAIFVFSGSQGDDCSSPNLPHTRGAGSQANPGRRPHPGLVRTFRRLL